MTDTDWLKTLEEIGALWKYEPVRGGPHAVWTTGVHSNGYINMVRLSERPDLLESMCAELILKAQDEGLLHEGNMPSWVIGPALGSVVIAYECARQLHAKAGFTEKVDMGAQLRRFFIKKGEMVLAVDDTMSTGSSVTKTIACLKDKGLSVLPFVLIIANYSGKSELAVGNDTHRIISLIEFEFNVHRWKPEECPLCKGGSEALRPKEHWEKFV
jgi:orotate phosphoribosyltransferase